MSVYRERDVRYTRERSPSDDDDRYKQTTTVRRYKVGGGGHSSSSRVVERDRERFERYDDDDDDRRSRYTHSHAGRPSGDVVEVDRRVERTTYPERSPGDVVEVDRRVERTTYPERSSGDLLEVDRRVERTTYPDRPRSALDPPSRGSDFYRGDGGDRYRTVEYEREREVDRGDRGDYVNRTRVVEESREVTSPRSPRDNYWDRQSKMSWDDADVRIDKRVVRREPDGDVQVKEKSVEIHRDEPTHEHRDYRERDVKIERRVVEESAPHEGEVERYRREVEYYSAPDPPPAPIVIRQKAPEPQQIIVQEAPAPAPVIVPRQDPGYIVLREQPREVVRPREDDYYYRPRRDDRRYESDGYDEDYYVKRTVIRRERSPSEDHHHKRHLAEGALAGAGLSALVASRRGKEADHQDNRGRKVLAGAALGAIGTEVIRRAKSAYEDRYEDEDDEYYDDRRRHRSKSRSTLTTGLAIGAAALAVASGLKYMQNNKIEKEEAHRGRARRRYSNDSYSRSPSYTHRSKSRSKSRSNANMAKAAAATGAIAGLVQHYRSKSQGKSRSKSRVRTGAEIAAAGLTGAAASKLWERHKDKKERDRGLEDENHDRDRSYSRSRSRSRSLSRNVHSRDTAADRELGLVPVVRGVEYGSEPLDGYDSPRDHRRRHHRRRHRSSSASDGEVKKKRSKSRLRDVAAAGLGTAAAAIGLKKYSDRQKSKERDDRPRQESREGSRDRSIDRKDRRRARRSRDRERRRYEEEAGGDPYYDYDVEAPPSPPHASGGAYFPPPPTGPAAPPAGFTHHSNQSTTNLKGFQPEPYDPRDYVGMPPPPPGPPPVSGPTPPPPPPPPAGPGFRSGPENVSHDPHSGDSRRSPPEVSRSAAMKQDGLKQRNRSPSIISISTISSVSSDFIPKTASSKVKFGPLSPQSSQTLRRHREEHGDRSGAEADDEDLPLPARPDESSVVARRPKNPRRRSDSDPSSNRRAVNPRRNRRQIEEEIEELPDRFDPSARPLDPRDSRSRDLRRAHTRRGEFEYRPQQPGNMAMRGSWMQVGNVDPEMINGIAQTVGDMLEGRKGVMGLLGHVLKDGLGGGGGREGRRA